MLGAPLPRKTLNSSIGFPGYLITKVYRLKKKFESEKNSCERGN
jgi:hypothetical protein